jgi:GNAT superfamily N-acetyltransferase
MPDRSAGGPIRIVPITPERFPDLERLFGPNGASCGCWCMWWRLPTAQFRAGQGDRNRLGLRRYVRAGHVPGLLAYDGRTAIGWIAVEPRASYPRLSRSRNLAPVDGAPVWSITCFYVDRRHRGRGVMRALIEAAAAHARAGGAASLEAYPREPSASAVDSSLYTGVPSTFRALGFVEVARRVPSRPILRLALVAGRLRGRRMARSSSAND